MNESDKNLARNLVEAVSFREMYARMYQEKRAGLLDDLLNFSRNDGIVATDQSRARAISEICGQVRQLEEFVPDLFRIADYSSPSEKAAAKVFIAAWNKQLATPQESEVNTWINNSQPEQRRLWNRIRVAAIATFLKIISAIRGTPAKLKASKV